MTYDNTNFKGKVIYYTNINGQEQRVEKEFNDPKEYQRFIEENNFQFPSINIGNPLDALFDKFFAHKLESFLTRPSLQYKDISNNGLPHQYNTQSYDQEYSGHLQRYEQKLREIEQQKREKQKRKDYLTNLIQKLQEYKKRFQEAGVKDEIKNIEKDIEKANKELKAM